MNAAYSDDGRNKLVTISKVHIGFNYETMINYLGILMLLWSVLGERFS